MLLVWFICTRMAFFCKAKREARGPESFWPSLIMLSRWFLNHRFNYSQFSSSKKWNNNTSNARLFVRLIKIMTAECMWAQEGVRGFRVRPHGGGGAWGTVTGWACLGDRQHSAEGIGCLSWGHLSLVVSLIILKNKKQKNPALGLKKKKV